MSPHQKNNSLLLILLNWPTLQLIQLLKNQKLFLLSVARPFILLTEKSLFKNSRRQTEFKIKKDLSQEIRGRTFQITKEAVICVGLKLLINKIPRD